MSSRTYYCEILSLLPDDWDISIVRQNGTVIKQQTSVRGFFRFVLTRTIKTWRTIAFTYGSPSLPPDHALLVPSIKDYLQPIIFLFDFLLCRKHGSLTSMLWGSPEMSEWLLKQWSRLAKINRVCFWKRSSLIQLPSSGYQRRPRLLLKRKKERGMGRRKRAEVAGRQNRRSSSPTPSLNSVLVSPITKQVGFLSNHPVFLSDTVTHWLFCDRPAQRQRTSQLHHLSCL